MPKIIINEVDQTSAVGATSTDIVYVPGLLGSDAPETKEFKEKWNTPVLCETVKQFESIFGTKPAVIATTDGVKYTHNSTVMLEPVNGSKDLGYVYAKELLNQGISVLYEAIVPEQLNEALAYISLGSWKGTAKTTAYQEDTTSEELSRNNNNTADINSNNIQGKEIYIKITGDTVKDYFVSVIFSDDSIISVKDVYEATFEGSNVTLGDKLAAAYTNGDVEKGAALDAFKLEKNKSVVIRATFNVEETTKLNAIAFVKVMISSKGYLPFRAYTGESTASVNYIYEVLHERLDRLTDKSLYDVKYITAGGYPTFHEDDQDLAIKMLNVAATRGDAVAFPDHTHEPARVLVGPGSLYNKAIKNNQALAADGTYGAMFTTYGEYVLPLLGDSIIMPGSFAYLMCLARAIKTSPNWLAMAGVARGIVPYINKLTCKQALSNVIADDFQPRTDGVSINGITNVRPYGLTIYGNRTLAKAAEELVAHNFLNTRVMLCDIKKQAYKTAKSLMFEQDNDVLWIKFRSGVSPLLDQLKSGGGISAYKLLKTNVDSKGNALGKGQMGIVIKVKPIYAVEYMDINVVITDDVEVA